MAMAFQASAQTLTSSSPTYEPASDIVVSWTGGSGNGKDWIGIYPAGITPGSQPSEDWMYIGGAQTSTVNGPVNGSVTFSNSGLTIGDYSLYYLSNDGFAILDGPVNFSVAAAVVPSVSTSKATYSPGETITVNFANGPGNAQDWIGIYPAGQASPDGSYLLWSYTNGAVSGSVDFTSPTLAAGSYEVYFLENNGYNVIAGSTTFVVDANNGGPAISTNTTEFDYNETISVNFSNGPGNAKDWVAIYPAGQTPANGSFVRWSYTNGSTSGSVNFSNPNLDPGNYDLFFLENDGYNVLSGPLSISVVSVPGAANPKWVKSSFKRIHGVTGTAYTGIISAYAADPDIGEALSFSKISGPSWLTVNSNGTLSGTPTTNHIGTNSFVVRATDTGGNFSEATMTIEVFANGAESVTELKILSYNLWHGFGKINRGYRKGLESIILSGADIIGTQETMDNVTGMNSNQAQVIADALGWHYSPVGGGDSGIISRYPITSEFTSGIANGIKAQITASPNKEIIFYNCHLDYLFYGPYAAEQPKANARKVLREEKQSQRDEQIAAIIAGMNSDLGNANNIPVFLSGDFNAPSHLDWTSATASSHYGVGYVAWPTSIACANAGLIDSFRAIHPDPVAKPGNTWSPLFKGTEPQDRIDFVYFKGNGVTVTASEMFNTPVEVTVGSWGNSIAPALNNTWPSDHSAVLSTFTISQ